MNGQKENIDFWIGRVLMIFLLLFVFSAFKSDYLSKGYSSDSSNTMEYALKTDISALLAEPISLPDFTNSSVSSKSIHFNSYTDNFEIIFSNIKANLLLRIGIDRFIKIKTLLIDINFCNIQTSLNDEDYLTIS